MRAMIGLAGSRAPVAAALTAALLGAGPAAAQRDCVAQIAVERAWIETDDAGPDSPCVQGREFVYAVAFEIESEAADEARVIEIGYAIELELTRRRPSGRTSTARESRDAQVMVTLEPGSAGLSATDRGWAACELGPKRGEFAGRETTRTVVRDATVRHSSCRVLEP